MSAAANSHAVGSRSHEEEHFRSADTARDVVIGMSEGPTLPFALVGGLSARDELQREIVSLGRPQASFLAGQNAVGDACLIEALKSLRPGQWLLLRKGQLCNEVKKSGLSGVAVLSTLRFQYGVSASSGYSGCCEMAVASQRLLGG
jgi:hypothetical protein